MVVHDDGVVSEALDETVGDLGRGTAAASSGDLRGAALTAAGQAAAGLRAPVASLGVAAHNPDSAECHIVLQALAERLRPGRPRRSVCGGGATTSASGGGAPRESKNGGAGRPAHKESASTSGTAAPVGEAWVGAGRQARDVVFFAVAEQSQAGIVRDGAPGLGPTRRAATIRWVALSPAERT